MLALYLYPVLFETRARLQKKTNIAHITSCDSVILNLQHRKTEKDTPADCHFLSPTAWLLFLSYVDDLCLSGDAERDSVRSWCVIVASIHLTPGANR